MTTPFTVSVLELGRRPGLSKHVDTEIVTDERIGTESLGVPAGGSVDVDVTLESVSDGVWVSGVVAGDATGECVRCLTALDERLEGSVDELVFYPERRAALVEEGDEEMADAPVVVEETVDLEPLVRDAIGLAVPFQPLCSPDCRGLCDGCGEPWENLPDDHTHEQTDPRWAALGAALAQAREAHGEDDEAGDGEASSR